MIYEPRLIIWNQNLLPKQNLKPDPIINRKQPKTTMEKEAFNDQFLLNDKYSIKTIITNEIAYLYFLKINYSCDIENCPRKYMSCRSLRRHLRMAHNIKTIINKCAICQNFCDLNTKIFLKPIKTCKESKKTPNPSNQIKNKPKEKLQKPKQIKPNTEISTNHTQKILQKQNPNDLTLKFKNKKGEEIEYNIPKQSTKKILQKTFNRKLSKTNSYQQQINFS